LQTEGRTRSREGLTHRVVATLAERGTVQVQKKGDSNDVTLARWFLDGMEG
jgi:hypothetical protein